VESVHVAKSVKRQNASFGLPKSQSAFGNEKISELSDKEFKMQDAFYRYLS